MVCCSVCLVLIWVRLVMVMVWCDLVLIWCVVRVVDWCWVWVVVVGVNIVVARRILFIFVGWVEFGVVDVVSLGVVVFWCWCWCFVSIFSLLFLLGVVW